MQNATVNTLRNVPKMAKVRVFWAIKFALGQLPPEPLFLTVFFSWAFPSLVTLLREEGLVACYKGLGMRLLRLGPGGGIMLVTFGPFCFFVHACLFVTV